MPSGYELADRMRKTRRGYPLTSTEQALYYELMAICNDDKWPDIFSCSNDELCRALCITENTLTAARLTLIQRRLIFYKSGKSKRQISQYSFKRPLTTSTNEVNPGVDVGVNPGVDVGVDAGTNGADIYKTERKKETETKTETSSGGEPPGEIKPDSFQPKKPEEEKEKKTPRPKKEKEVTAHWKKLVEVWFTFYHGKTSLKPTFDGPAAKCMQTIANRLESMATERGDVWTEKYATDAMLHFFTMAYNLDDWLRANFMLPNLCSKFDAIINPNNHGHPKATGKPANGAKATSEQLSASYAKFYNQS